MGDRLAVLGIDQAARSGAAYLTRHSVRLWACTTTAHRLACVRAARELAAADGATLVAVLEDHSDVPLRKHSSQATGTNAATLLGMGDARGRWRELLDLYGVRHCMVAPAAWRPLVGIPANTRAERAKEMAQTWAAGYTAASVRHDEAEALAIAYWGRRSPEVAQLAAKRRRKAALGAA